jgi:agmatinase
MIQWKQVFCALVISLAWPSAAEVAQYPVGIAYPTPINYTQVFSGEFMGTPSWSKSEWNGLTSFARATPLRCFGSDAATKYDVAVIGMQ